MKRQFIQGIFEIFQQVIRYNLVWGSLPLINGEMVYEKRKLYQTRLYKFLPLLRRFNPAEPVVEKYVIL